MMPRIRKYTAGVLLLVCGLFLNGCYTPVGVNRVSPRSAYQDANTNPLSEGVVSDRAKYVLNRYDLLDKFSSDPAEAIAELHKKALHDDRRDILYALAETSYLYGGQLANSAEIADQRRAPDYFLLTSIYAYFFVMEERHEPRPTAFDRRGRNALDLYNFGLLQGLATGENGEFRLEGNIRKLPFGQLSIALNTEQFPWKLDEFSSFEPADAYVVRGVSVRDRTPGIGLPLIAIKKAESTSSLGDGQAIPVTAFLRIHGNLASLSAGTASAEIELYSVQKTSTILVHNKTVPLETDTTTPLAYSLERSDMWDFGISAFLGREGNKHPDGLFLQAPYQPGKIPVVFVHGTASSPVWWTEMFNTLNFDPLIRQKYQFWYFVYTSNKPVVVSAAELRDAMRAKVALLDPEGKDSALQQMVVVGHSQGGLLTKLTAVDTGEKLVQAVTGKDLESLKMSAENEARAAHLLIIKPLPFVKEVIFLSTPHRGSFRSKWWNRNLVKAIISLPATMVKASLEYYDYVTDDVKKLAGGKKSVFTSADGQSPDNPLLKALAEIPLSSGVTGHSIIGVKGDGDPKLGDDGVVKYSSAHLDGMASELIVHSGHSTQLNPLAIDEVRRILVEHLAGFSKAIDTKKILY